MIANAEANRKKMAAEESASAAAAATELVSLADPEFAGPKPRDYAPTMVITIGSFGGDKRKSERAQGSKLGPLEP